jgi:hypothetical protein
MAAKLTILTHKIAIQLHLVAESSTTCSCRSRRTVRKLLNTPSYNDQATSWTTRVRFLQEYGSFSSPPRPDRLWGPLSGWVVKMTTHLHLVPWLRMSRVVSPLPHKYSQRGTQLSTGYASCGTWLSTEAPMPFLSLVLVCIFTQPYYEEIHDYETRLRITYYIH